jgi:hypothetical protein
VPSAHPVTLPVGMFPLARPGSAIPVTFSMPSILARDHATARVPVSVTPGPAAAQAAPRYGTPLTSASSTARPRTAADGGFVPPIMPGMRPAIFVPAPQQLLSTPPMSVVLTQQDKDQNKRDRRESRRRNEEREYEQQAADTENRELTRRYLRIGLFFLPLVHCLELLYFRKELVDRKNTDFIVLRNLGWAMLAALLYLAGFISWFIAFQVSPDRFPNLNILNHNTTFAALL